MDKIFIRDLEIETIVGIYQHELVNKQKIILDIEFATNTKAIAETDHIQDTIDYDEVIATIYNLCEARRFNLIESLVEYLAANILSEFHTSWVSITLTKPCAVSATKNVGITIERTAN